jgi:RimJ/RimL family protein N-acetyltransferase
MAPTLHTARLVLTPVGSATLAPSTPTGTTPRSPAGCGTPTRSPSRPSPTLVTRSTHTFQTAGWGLWALRPATAAPLIGVCGLSPFHPTPGIELLYSLAPTHWSRGLATEAATAVMAYAFEVLALPELLATSDDANHPSRRVLTRLNAIPALRVQIGPHTYPCYRIRPSTDPGMLHKGPCSSMDRATDF